MPSRFNNQESPDTPLRLPGTFDGPPCELRPERSPPADVPVPTAMNLSSLTPKGPAAPRLQPADRAYSPAKRGQHAPCACFQPKRKDGPLSSWCVTCNEHSDRHDTRPDAEEVERQRVEIVRAHSPVRDPRHGEPTREFRGRCG